MKDLRTRQEKVYEFERWMSPSDDDKRMVRDFVARPPSGTIFDRTRSQRPSSVFSERVTVHRCVPEGIRFRPGAVLQILVAQCNSGAAAREALMDVLAGTMAKVLQQDVDGQLGVGEVAFAPAGTPVLYVVSTRSNVVVQVQSVGGVEVPVLDAARDIDAQVAVECGRSRKGS